tara:strand:- start:6900 stop:7298 length:399 start_codon:yes stop_codon:yes gene_type:complete
MPDAVATQTLVDNTQRAVFKFTNISDGTGEVAALKIDVSTLSSYLGNACTGVSIQRVDAITSGMGINMLWDATTDVVILTVGEADFVSFDFSRFGGLTNDSGTGKTGDILFSTVGATLGDRYTVVMEVLKNY